MSRKMFFVMNMFILVLVLVSTHPGKGASTALKGSYDKTATLSSGKALLNFRIDEDKRIAHFGLVITDNVTIRSDFPSYLGLGIGEPSSGSMLGSDIATAEFKAGANNDKLCAITDRHTLFEPFPLTERGRTGGVFPRPDTCPETDWTLVNCARDAEKGVLILEIRRSLDKGDDQDRAIGPGDQQVLYAYGNQFVYHGPNRASNTVHLYGKLSSARDVPDDLDGNWTLINTNFTLPKRSTTYSCLGVIADVPKGKARMIIGGEPIIRNEEIVHHFVVYVCQNNRYFQRFLGKTKECLFDGPFGNPDANCTGMGYAWAKGSTRFFYPNITGQVINDDNKYLILETHYDGVGQGVDISDSSGATLFYTDKMRKEPGGIMALGDFLVTRTNQTVQNGLQYNHTCPKECTGLMEKPVTVFGSGLHMHTTGKRIWTNQYDRDGNFIASRNGINFWSNSFQKFVPTNWTINPGDQLSTSCTYDTSKRPKTKFGLSTSDEMCTHILWVYPVPTRKDTGDAIVPCGSVVTGPNTTLTFCSSPKNFSRGILPIPNPSFEDSAGFNNTFGQTPICRATTEPSESPEESSGTGAPLLPEGMETQGPEEGQPIPSPTDEPVCFPQTSTVELENGKIIAMSDLAIGDGVRVSSGQFSEVYLFSHRSPHIRSKFIKIQASSTKISRVLTVSPGHYVWTNRGLVSAASVNVGDMLFDAKDDLLVVKETKLIDSVGLFSPHTMDGNIVVDGVRASTYSNVLPATVAHALLLPERLAYRLGFSVYGGQNYVSRKCISAPSGRPFVIGCAVRALEFAKVVVGT